MLQEYIFLRHLGHQENIHCLYEHFSASVQYDTHKL